MSKGKKIKQAESKVLPAQNVNVIEEQEVEGLPYEKISDGDEAIPASAFDHSIKQAYAEGKSTPRSKWRTIRFNMDIVDPIKADAEFQKLFFKENKEKGYGMLKDIEFLRKVTSGAHNGWTKGMVVRFPPQVAKYYTSHKYYLGGGFEGVSGPVEMLKENAEIVHRFLTIADYVDDVK